jgi:hypothetical protein
VIRQEGKNKLHRPTEPPKWKVHIAVQDVYIGNNGGFRDIFREDTSLLFHDWHQKTRERWAAALQYLDLFRSFGEYEEQQLDDARLIQNRVDASVTVGFNVQLLPSHRPESPGLAHHFGIAAHRVVLSENVASCVMQNCCNVRKKRLPSSPYGESHKK